ncbi:MAG: threonine/serine dehydratase [Candidatus Woesearchaeota archaeon]
MDFSAIEDAWTRVKPWIVQTPLLKSDFLSETYDSNVYLKLECLQRTGSFKVRGAFNKVLLMDQDAMKRGIVTVSSGNHAVALSYVGKKLDVKVTAVMPNTAPRSKIELIKTYGADIVFHGENYQEALELGLKISSETGATFVHSYDDPDVIAGQGTVAVELLKQLPNPEVVVIGVGGGALFGGMAAYLKKANPKISLVAVQPEKVATVDKSLQAGNPVKLSTFEKTVADGLATGKIGNLVFDILRSSLSKFIPLNEHEIEQAILFLVKREKIVAEGAGAATVAALSHLRHEIAGRTTVCIISGGNIDLDLLRHIISENSQT